MARVKVGEADSFSEGQIRTLEIGEIPVLVCRSGEEFFAIENRCTHQDTPLAGGRVRRGFIACPLHGVMFDLRTGVPRGELTKTPVRTFATEVTDGVLYVVSED